MEIKPGGARRPTPPATALANAQPEQKPPSLLPRSPPNWREAQTEGEGSAPPSNKGNSFFQQQAGAGCTGWGCAPAALLSRLQPPAPRVSTCGRPAPQSCRGSAPPLPACRGSLVARSVTRIIYRLQTCCKELARTRSAWESGTLTRSASLGAVPWPLPCCQL